MPVDWSRLVELVRQHQRFVLTSHVKPDCDALGSELALAGILESLGKEVCITNADAVPERLAFLDPENKIRQLGPDVQAADLADAEVLVVLDTSAWDQLGDMAEVVRQTKARIAVIDHHVSEQDLGGEVFKEVEAPATGCLVFELAEQLGAEITPSVAEALFAAIATDTGWFRFGSTRASTYRIGAALLEAGVEPARIYQALYEQSTLERVQLTGRILARTETELDGRLAHTCVTREDFEATGALPSDTEDVINVTLTIRGVEASVLLVELPSGEVKASFRSRSEFDVRQIAEQFGGGGHKAAAGARLPGPLDAAKGRVLDALRAGMR